MIPQLYMGMIDINLIFHLTPRKPNDLPLASTRHTSNIYTNEMHNIMNYPSVLVKSYNLATSTMCLERSETKRNEKIIRFINMALILIFEKVELQY